MPVGHITIKFDSIKFNSLGILFTFQPKTPKSYFTFQHNSCF